MTGEQLMQRMTLNVWIGMVEVAPRDDARLLDGAVGAFVSVLALVDSGGEFVSQATKFLEAEGFYVLNVEDVETFEHRVAHGKPADEIVHLAKGLSENNPIAVSTFAAYEHDEGAF